MDKKTIFKTARCFASGVFAGVCFEKVRVIRAAKKVEVVEEPEEVEVESVVEEEKEEESEDEDEDHREEPHSSVMEKPELNIYAQRLREVMETPLSELYDTEPMLPKGVHILQNPEDLGRQEDYGLETYSMILNDPESGTQLYDSTGTEVLLPDVQTLFGGYEVLEENIGKYEEGALQIIDDRNKMYYEIFVVE